MSATTNVQVVIDAKDNASSVIKSVGSSVSSAAKNIELDFKGAAIMATTFLGSLTALATGAVKVASSFEQNRISFETMTGSAQKAKDIMTALAKFTLETPFELPQVVQGAKSLMAYGIAAEDIIPTFKMLGDMAAGVGMDKLPNLVLAFGQVKAATKLTGMELRQFTEAGVPLLQALVDQANKTGGVLTSVGKASKVTAGDVVEMNEKLSIAKERLKEVEGNTKAKTSAILSAKDAVDNYQDKIAKMNNELNTGGKTMVKVKATTESMREAITDGAISFEQVQSALKGMTGEGGKFQDLMLKQSKTFAGLISNIKDKITQSLSEIAGVSVSTGEIREGSLFAVLKRGAEELYKMIDVVQPKIISFFTWFSQNQSALAITAGIIGGLLTAALVGLAIAFGPAIALATAFAVAGAAIGLAIVALKKVWDENFLGIRDTIETVKIKVTEFWNTVTIKFDEGKVYLEKIFEDLDKFYKDHKDEIDKVIIAITVFFIPAIIKLGVESAITGAIMAAKLIIHIISLGVQAGITAAVGLWSLIINTIKWGIEGWKVIAMLMIKIILIGIATAAFIAHTVVTIAQTAAAIGLTVATWALNAALAVLTSPIFLVIAAIVALIVIGVLLYKNWDKIKAEAIEKFEAIKTKINEVVEWIRTLIDNFKPRISIGLDLPDIAGAWNNLKTRAHNIGVPGFATGGIIPGPVGAPALVMAHGGERVTPNGVSGGGGGGSGVVFNVEIGLYAGSETEKRNIAQDLYSSLVQVAQSQNKTVKEFLGA